MTNPVFVALDTPDLTRALALAETVRPHVGGLKVGLEFFCAQGPEGVRQIVALGKDVFLDLKLHDIPNTVAKAVQTVSRLGVRYLTIHCSGGPAMLRAAAEAAALAGERRPRLLGVTVLTSLDDVDLTAVGQAGPCGSQVERLAGLAVACGLDGLVIAPPEIAAVRQKVGPAPTLLVPGIRPEGADHGDQKRVMTATAAMAAGADLLVIGRPITAAPDAGAAASRIRAELQATGQAA